MKLLLALAFVLVSCSARQRSPVLPEGDEPTKPIVKEESAPTDETPPEGEIDLGFQGDYKDLGLNNQPTEEPDAGSAADTGGTDATAD